MRHVNGEVENLKALIKKIYRRFKEDKLHY